MKRIRSPKRSEQVGEIGLFGRENERKGTSSTSRLKGCRVKGERGKLVHNEEKEGSLSEEKQVQPWVARVALYTVTFLTALPASNVARSRTG